MWGYDDYLAYQDEPTMCKCEKCNGTGRYYSLYNLRTGQEIECTEDEYENAYNDEVGEADEVLLERGIEYIQCEDYDCDECDGTGEVIDESNGEDWSDFD